MPKIITAAEAAQLIQDGMTVATTGFVGCGHAEALTAAVEERFLATGTPLDLTLIYGAGQGDGKDRGLNHFGYEGLVRRVIGGHWNLAPKLGRLAVENKIEAYNLPQGTLVQLFRATAGKRPGILTTVGLRTFVDPRVEGGKLNARTQEDLVRVMTIDGDEFLFYKSVPIDVALIRGSVADERGNLSMHREVLYGEALPLAQAAHNNGGIVIAQVERVVAKGSIDPKLVKVPGVCVDYIVVASPEQHMQTFGTIYDPAFTGEVRVPLSAVQPLPMDERKIIARRSAMELPPNAIVNLGIGIPEGVSVVANEEGIGDTMTLTVESGPIGGVPAGGLNFGGSINPEAIVDQPAQFDFYDGGGLDIAFLGMAQLDQEGNVNVSRFGPRIAGSGGFINITQNAKKVVFCGTMTASGLVVKVEEGKLVIEQEGKVKKMVSAVEQITFSGSYARHCKQPVLYVTERAVFELRPEGVVLTEVAPGVNPKTDIFDQMDFKPLVAPDLKTMDARIFSLGLMGLKTGNL